MNPRKTFDEEKLNELAENIEKQGLLQPITVRPGKEQGYEIVCGERRYRACLMLMQRHPSESRYAEMLGIVRELSDDEAFDAMITENLQRKDVDPLEEAFAFSQLIEKGNSADEIAARFGKSVRFVQDRVKLNNLIPEFKNKIQDGTLPLVSAILISRLNETQQKDIWPTLADADSIPRIRAQRVIDTIFSRIEKSLWVENDMSDYKGPCGRGCAECPMNTANVGCLFHDDAIGTNAQCTDREKFNAKRLHFIVDYLKDVAKPLPVGAPLDGRPVVLLDDEVYQKENTKKIEELRAMLDEAGIPYVDSDPRLGGKFWDSSDIKEEKLAAGEIYPVIDLSYYSYPGLNKYYVHVKKDVKDGTPGHNGDSVSPEVSSLVREYRLNSEKNHCMERARAIIKNAEVGDGELTAIEKEVFLLATLGNASKRYMADRLVPGIGYEDDEKRRVAHNRPELFNLLVRKLLLEMLNDHGSAHILDRMLDVIGSEWCRDDYIKAKHKAEKATQKRQRVIKLKLAELGYDTEGNKTSYTKEELDAIPLEVTNPLYEEYAKMRERHPDAVLLFRVGDFYEIFGDDAEFAAGVLGITLTSRTVGKTTYKLAGFPHHALDKYLPKLTRAGRRLAICETPKQ